jgi:hypothetical protein
VVVIGHGHEQIIHDMLAVCMFDLRDKIRIALFILSHLLT